MNLSLMLGRSFENYNLLLTINNSELALEASSSDKSEVTTSAKIRSTGEFTLTLSKITKVSAVVLFEVGFKATDLPNSVFFFYHRERESLTYETNLTPSIEIRVPVTESISSPFFSRRSFESTPISLKESAGRSPSSSPFPPQKMKIQVKYSVLDGPQFLRNHSITKWS